MIIKVINCEISNKKLFAKYTQFKSAYLLGFLNVRNVQNCDKLKI